MLENVVVLSPPPELSPIGSEPYWASVRVPCDEPLVEEADTETVPDVPLGDAEAVFVCGSGAAVVTLVTVTGWAVTKSVCSFDSPSVKFAGVLSTVI